MLHDPWFYVSLVAPSIGFVLGAIWVALARANDERYRRILSEIQTRRY